MCGGVDTHRFTGLHNPDYDWIHPAFPDSSSRHARAACLTGGSSSGRPPYSMNRPGMGPRTFWAGIVRSHVEEDLGAEPRWVYGAKFTAPEGNARNAERQFLERQRGHVKRGVNEFSTPLGYISWQPRDRCAPLTRSLLMGVNLRLLSADFRTRAGRGAHAAERLFPASHPAVPGS